MYSILYVTGVHAKLTPAEKLTLLVSTIGVWLRIIHRMKIDFDYEK
jgi:hypothetical protein